MGVSWAEGASGVTARYAAIVSILFIGSGCISLSGCNSKATDTLQKKVIVLGFDGMDPQILQRLVRDGKLPNFARLMTIGDFKPLATSMPPQSPVAWATFITGMNPGGHGIFDFIHMDPETLTPYLSTSKAEPAKRTVRIGQWEIPLSSGKVTLLRHGKAFWEILEEKGISATIVRVPANFPPAETQARQLSGMGTPDIQGTYGTFSFYTTEPVAKYHDVSGGEVFPVTVAKNKVQGELFGPINSFRRGAPQTAIPFTVFIDPTNPVAKIVLSDHQILLKEGEWSDWVSVTFPIVPMLYSVSSICRFYLKEIRPEFKLYVTPINIDPASPALPISTPDHYSEELAEEIGPFYTQGIPEDTNALSADVLDDEEFLQQTQIALDEELRMFEREINRFSSGLLFFYIGRTDQLAHMFWRTMDPQHPAYNQASRHQHVIEDTYRDVDRVLGKAMQKIDAQTTLIVLSDHGFAPFYRAFSLNTWLKNEGYIAVTNDDEGELFRNVNWAKTRAYGVGFNGLYVNLYGREKRGAVHSGPERERLLAEITEKLLAVRDPKTGEQVVSKVYRAETLYTGPYVQRAPDLIIGYNKGYRSSWETVLGEFPKDLLRDNTEKWSGDHLMAAELVPGILLANKPIVSAHPSLQDLAPTILAEFGIAKESGMIGSAVLSSRE